MEMIRFDAHFGTVIEGPWTASDREPGKEQILGQCHAPAARLRA